MYSIRGRKPRGSPCAFSGSESDGNAQRLDSSAALRSLAIMRCYQGRDFKDSIQIKPPPRNLASNRDAGRATVPVTGSPSPTLSGRKSRLICLYLMMRVHRDRLLKCNYPAVP